MVTSTVRQTKKEELDGERVLQRLGRLFEQARIERELSERELGKLAGISRSNVRFAVQGGNITVLTLLGLVRALAIPSQALAELGLEVVAAVAHLEEASAHLSEAAGLIRGQALGARPASNSDDTDAQVADLVRELTAKAKTLGHHRLSALDETLRGMVANAEEEEVQPTKARPHGAGWRQAK
jgi:hypothetical protein